MRDFIKALPLGLLLPLVIGAASVKPDDAISNIADWAHRLGFSRVPAWVSNPAADNRIILGSFGIAVVYAFLIWTVPVIKESRANPGSDRLKNHLLLMAFLFASAALVAAIWRFVPAQLQPAKIAPPIVAPSPPAPPKPVEPWVGEEEFQNAKKIGRLLLPFTPEELGAANYSQGSVGTDAYVGKWVKIKHPFMSVRPLTEKDKKEYLIVTILQPLWPAYLIFDAKKWGDQLLVMKGGSVVKAVCQLTKYDKGAYDTSAPKFIGQNCELS
jgi:hypothetical protein